MPARLYRPLTAAASVLLCLARVGIASAQLVANGTSLTATTANAVATFAGPDLVGFVNSVTNETYLKNATGGELATINAYSSSGAWVVSNWSIGVEGGTGDPLATITAHDDVRTLTLSVKIDAASQEIVVRLAASVGGAGLRGASWSIAGLDFDAGRLIVPAYTGLVFDKSHPIGDYMNYPDTWHAQMAVYEGAAGSFVLYSTDALYAYKTLGVTTRGQSTVDVSIWTNAFGPFGNATSVPTVEWRLKAFAGDWRAAAQVYRNWLATNRPPVSNAAHPWVSNIRTVVKLGSLDPNILPAIAAQVAPAQTLLYIFDWRQNAYDVNYPDYTPRAGVASFVAAAHGLGFKVMLHCDFIGVSPGSPDYPSMQAWQVRDPESLALVGWQWQMPPSTPYRFAYINPAASAFRSLWITRVAAAVNAVAPDALHLDISGPVYNDGNGLIGGMNYGQGSAQMHQDIIAAFPNLALGGESENDIVYRYESFAQAWATDRPALGHPIATFLFGPQVRYYGHLSQPDARSATFKNYLAAIERRAIEPAWAVGSALDTDPNDPDNARLLGILQSWQTHSFEPAWAADWTGALIRYQGSAASTAALTDSGTQTVLTAAGSTLFTQAHDANQVANGAAYIRNWPAFDSTTLFGLDPAHLYFLDSTPRPTTTHVTSVPAGNKIGASTLITSSAAHVEILQATQAFDFQASLLTAHVGVRYNGIDYPLAYGAVVYSSTITAGGEARSGLFLHPPYQGQIGGETFVEYSLPIPASASLLFDVGVADNAACTDGVTFRVTASGTELWHEHITRTGWHHLSVSLAAYAGTTIPVRIISNPGPANSPNCDWSLWNQVMLNAPSATTSVPIALAAGSVFSGFAGDGSFALNGSNGTVSNLPVPGRFTVFTQTGPTVAAGTNLANLAFDVWSGAHGDILGAGSVFGAGSVGSNSAGGVAKNPSIFAHPPDGGRTVLSWTVRLPSSPLRLWWSAGIRDGATSFDGVDFQVVVNGTPLWHLPVVADQWIPGTADLAAWAGQSVLIELVTDCISDFTFDWALWGDLVFRDSAFTDASLSAGVSIVKAVHILELRQRIDALRARAGLALYGWTNPTLTIGSSPVTAQHVAELRAALAAVYTARGLTPPAYTDAALGPGLTIKRLHITELRSAVVAIE
jgi:uncharacterized protein DUF6259